jgi:hypothetical protein
VLDLRVQMRFVRLAVVPDRGQWLATPYDVADLDGDESIRPFQDAIRT